SSSPSGDDMGKASRSKRDRREGAADSKLTSTPPPERRQFPVFWAVIGALVVAGIVALVVTAPENADDEAEKAAENVPTYADVSVSGDELPRFSGPDNDSAVGKEVPRLSGTQFDGLTGVIAPDGDTARVYVVLAHWCPHCQ